MCISCRIAPILAYILCSHRTPKPLNVSLSPNPDDIIKENANYIRERKPINFTLSDLEEDDDEDAFTIDVQPSTSRSMPTRSCKPNNFPDGQDNSETDESCSDDSDDQKYEYPEDSFQNENPISPTIDTGSSVVSKRNENKQENQIESTKNSRCDKSNGDDSDQIDWNPTGDPNYNPYSEDEHEPWNPYGSSDEPESD